MLDTAPIAYLRCTRPTLVPLACPGRATLGVWPRHPKHTLVRLDARGDVVAHLWLPTDDTFSLVRYLIADGTLTPMSASCAAVLFRAPRRRWHRWPLR